MSDKQPAQDPIAEDSRIEALDARLKAAREREDLRANPDKGKESNANYQLGNRVLAELLGGIGGGALIGWVIDQFGRTAHWGLLVVMMLGIVVAFRNIIRISNRRPD